jgi:hypothetical protein
MNAFLGWCYQNLDSDAIMKGFEDVGRTDAI